LREDVKVIFNHFKEQFGPVNSAKKINIPEQLIIRRDLVERYGAINGVHTPIDPEISIRPVKVRGIPCEWICAPNADKSKVMLYIHGGAFLAGSLNSHRPLSCEITKRSGVCILAVDYRLAPEHPFPAGLDDCFDVYDWLLENGPDGKSKPESIFIGGDSAGGNLSLALLLKIKKINLRMPDACITFSPVVDFDGKGASISSLDGVDPVLNKKALIKGLPLVYLFGRDILKISKSKIKNAPILLKVLLNKKKLMRNPLVSPIYGDLTGLPPIMIHMGEYELLRDDATSFAEKARRQGVDITLKVWPQMVHVFIAFLGYVPEAEQCYDEMADFIRKHSKKDQFQKIQL
jgi:monoterpene epsilon-lactone hydrolase